MTTEIEPATDAELETLELFGDMADVGTLKLLARIRQEQAEVSQLADEKAIEQARQAELRQENERLRSDLRVQTAIAEQNKDDVRKVMAEREAMREAYDEVRDHLAGWHLDWPPTEGALVQLLIAMTEFRRQQPTQAEVAR